MSDDRDTTSQDPDRDGAVEPGGERSDALESDSKPADADPTAAQLLSDPDLAPELARKVLAFFGEDGELELPVRRSEPPPPSTSEKRAAEQRARLEALLEHADAELLDRLQVDRAPLRADAAGFSDRAYTTVTAREPKLALQIRPIELVDWDQPEAIEDALRDNTPQALLRDLHRPVFDFDPERETHLLPSIADRVHQQAARRAFAATRELHHEATIQWGKDALDRAREALGMVRETLRDRHDTIGRKADDDHDITPEPN